MLNVGFLVLIESDWNLKAHDGNFTASPDFVLIESDWNLKQSPGSTAVPPEPKY